MGVLLIILLSGADDGGTEPGAASVLEAQLHAAFAHCEGMKLRTQPMLALDLPSPCMMPDGRTAQGVMTFEFIELASADAPVRRRERRLRVTAAPFTLSRVQLEGVLLEARMSEDGRDLTLLPRRQPVKTRTLAPPPGKRSVESAPATHRPFDPLGDVARDVVRFVAASPAVVAGVGDELRRVVEQGTVQSAPELVALWVMTAPGAPPDAGT
jgi:hypothetical protein